MNEAKISINDLNVDENSKNLNEKRFDYLANQNPERVEY